MHHHRRQCISADRVRGMWLTRDLYKPVGDSVGNCMKNEDPVPTGL